ncbi:MAG: hypothetical protein OXH92_14145 [Bryobacterales bacterium]|nr:hypothetical protein [Bryobacterales bacterium]MDE0293433.1 hypothetical protein [Bryobacterales bacterium]MDE0435139.1 hypothetical protein [Bryobacterales bacterium]
MQVIDSSFDKLLETLSYEEKARRARRLVPAAATPFEIGPKARNAICVT